MIRKLAAVCLAISVAFSGLMADGMAQTKKKQRGPSLPLIRDAEIEGLVAALTEVWSRLMQRSAA